MKNERNNEEALNAFIGEIGWSLEILDRLKSHLLDHMGTNPDDVTWGDVGTAAHVRKELLELHLLLGLEPEA